LSVCLSVSTLAGGVGLRPSVALLAAAVWCASASNKSSINQSMPKSSPVICFCFYDPKDMHHLRQYTPSNILPGSNMVDFLKKQPWFGIIMTIIK
jgi:hypothetical protein